MLLLACASAAGAQHSGHAGMSVDADGIVMNGNSSELPRGCAEISGDESVTVRAGRAYATDAPGTVFGLSRYEVRVPPCSRVNVTLINEDDVRHQWMVHGLPKYLYPAGMFHLEAMPGRQKTGTFIVPGEDRNYLVHCDMAQHMEKGMRGQLVVGDGSGDLWSITGISSAFLRADYLPTNTWLFGVLSAIAGMLATFAIVRLGR